MQEREREEQIEKQTLGRYLAFKKVCEECKK